METVITESPQTVELVQVANTKMSYEEFLVKYDGKYAEFVNGEIITDMSVTKTHNEITNFLSFILQAFAEIKKVGRIYGEPYQMKMRFEDETIGREPDIFFVKNENFNKLNEKFFDGGADLVIEVISPESRGRDRGEKFYEYETAGVKEYWLIDTERKQAEFYTLGENGYFSFVSIENGIFESKVLQGLTLKVQWLWQDELPTLMEVLKDWKLV